MFISNFPIHYDSIQLGSAEVTVKNEHVALYVDDISWMGLNLKNFWQINEWIVEILNARGVCIITGLGLGALPFVLSSNPNVTKIKIYEKSADVIEIFKIIAKKNNIDLSKYEIINEDANKMSGEICDCIFLDHTEQEGYTNIINLVRPISKNNTFDFIWFWPAANYFIRFCLRNRCEINQSSYDQWKIHIGLENLPKFLSDETFEHIKLLKDIYKIDAKGGKLSNAIIRLELKNSGAVPNGGL